MTVTPRRAHPRPAELPRVSCSPHSRARRTAVLGSPTQAPRRDVGREPEPQPASREPPHLNSCQQIRTTPTFADRNAIKLEAIFKRQLEKNTYIWKRSIEF